MDSIVDLDDGGDRPINNCLTGCMFIAVHVRNSSSVSMFLNSMWQDLCTKAWDAEFSVIGRMFIAVHVRNSSNVAGFLH